MIAEIISALEPLVAERVFPLRAPQGTAKPFMTFQRAGGVPSNTFCGNTDKENGRFQFNVWADTQQQAAEIMAQAREILCSAPFRGTVLSEPQWAEGYDTRTFGTVQDISLWWPSATT